MSEARVIQFAVAACRACVNAAPLVGRELRSECQRPANHWLRLLAAGSMIIVFASLMLASQIDASQIGAALFAMLYRTLFYGFWLVVPLMTADCISREKREGTLPLIFLTPLNVLEVIVAKAATHTLRAATLFLAAAPILVLPFVLGGVARQHAGFAFIRVSGALLLGIAAGLYASTKGGSTIQVMVWSEWYALVLALICGFAMEFIGLVPFVFPFALLPYLVFCLLFHIIAFGIVLGLSIRRLKATWQDEPENPGQPAWVKHFSNSEFWQELFRWDKSRTLDRNPMAWLQEYSWTARLTKWGWFLILLLIDLVVMTDWDSQSFLRWLPALTGGLALSVAFSAANSFRRERQTGLLEILLVTPIPARQVIGGRLWGMVCNFFPAIAALCVCWEGIRLLNSHASKSGLFYLLFPSPLAFGALMVVGLYLSLTRLNLFLAWLLTWTLAFLLPCFVTVVLGAYLHIAPTSATLLSSAFQLLLATTIWFLLQHTVRSRAFLEARQ